MKYSLIGVIGMTVVIMFMSGQAKKEADKADQARLAAMSPESRTAEVAQRQAAAASEAQRKAAAEKAAAEADARLHDIGMAEVTCSMLAEKRANDPSSVEWIRGERKFAYTSKDMKRATSVQAMRAKNAMGGLVRTAVKCDLFKGETGWNVKKFEELH